MIRLSEQMRQCKPDVECRVAEMNHLMVQQHQLLLVNEDVLRTVVAVDERQTRGKRIGDEPVKESASHRMLRRGVAIVRLQAEALEETSIVEFSRKSIVRF